MLVGVSGLDGPNVQHHVVLELALEADYATMEKLDLQVVKEMKMMLRHVFEA